MVVVGGVTFGNLLFHHNILSFYHRCNNIHYQMNQIYKSILIHLVPHLQYLSEEVDLGLIILPLNEQIVKYEK
ncbi:hypothetical protein PG301_09970 [Parageobacillus sp. G301]|jgi:hypothetical protein|nr:hypothetical protein PG301_09970 [Parageobacillus sp. G301]